MLRVVGIALCSLFLISHSYAQSVFYQKNGNVTVARGTLYINGDLQVTTPISNSGTITVTGDLTNEGTTGIFEGQSGTVVLIGSSDQDINATGGWEFNTLILNKASGNVNLNSNIQVDDRLQFNGGNMNLSTHQVDLGMTGVLSGENENSRIYATTGVVKAKQTLMNPLGTEDIAGLGLYIHSPDEVFGSTIITRGHQSIAEAGSGSIARWFNILPGAAGPSESVAMRYFDSDGVSDESSLQFYAKRATATQYFPSGGVVNTSTNEVYSIYFLSFEEEMITLAPVINNSTCDETDPDYVAAVFLVPTVVTEDDVVSFVNLSLPAPDQVNSIWNTGDGFSFSTEDIMHPYADPNDYNVMLSVNNSVCASISSKQITVRQNYIRQNNNLVVSDLINTFLFYPNPIQDDLNWVIDFTDSYESNLSLMDIFGRTVFKKQYHQKSIEDHQDFSALPAGLYLLKLEVMGRLYTYRIVKL